jgi:hypothetical protein
MMSGDVTEIDDTGHSEVNINKGILTFPQHLAYQVKN